MPVLSPLKAAEYFLHKLSLILLNPLTSSEYFRTRKGLGLVYPGKL